MYPKHGLTFVYKHHNVAGPSVKAVAVDHHCRSVLVVIDPLLAKSHCRRCHLALVKIGAGSFVMQGENPPTALFMEIPPLPCLYCTTSRIIGSNAGQGRIAAALRQPSSEAVLGSAPVSAQIPCPARASLEGAGSRGTKRSWGEGAVAAPKSVAAMCKRLHLEFDEAFEQARRAARPSLSYSLRPAAAVQDIQLPIAELDTQLPEVSPMFQRRVLLVRRGGAPSS